MRRLIILVVLLGGGIQAQVTQNTVYEALLTDTAAVPTTSAVVTNIAQSGHMISIYLKDNTPNVCNLPAGNPSFRAEFSWDQVTWFAPSMAYDSAIVDALGNIYVLGMLPGAFPYVRVTVATFDTANCLVDVFYTGISGGQPIVTDIGRAITPGTDGWSNHLIAHTISSDLSIGSLLVSPMLFDGTAWDRALGCDLNTDVTVGVNTTAQVVALAAGHNIKVCSFLLSSAANGTIQFVEGTGVNCAVGTANIIGAMHVGANAAISQEVGLGKLFQNTTANALRVATAGGASAVGYVSWARY
jgi:hypothetical protein